MEPTTNQQRVKRLVSLGMLAAVAFVAKWISTPFPQVMGFLSFDLKDSVIVIGGFLYGPLAAAALSAIVSFIEMYTISTTGWIGFLMNVLASCSFACAASALYQAERNMRGAIFGLILGTLSMTAVMLLWNWLITPLYMKVDRQTVVGILVPVFLPFNLVKAGINSTIALLLYKPIVTALRKAGLAPAGSGAKRERKWGLTIASAALFATFVLLALVLAGKL